MLQRRAVEGGPKDSLAHSLTLSLTHATHSRHSLTHVTHSLNHPLTGDSPCSNAGRGRSSQISLLQGDSIPGLLGVRAKCLEANGLPEDAFLPSAAQKQGQKAMRTAWETTDEGHAWGPSLKPLLQRRACRGIGFGIFGGRSPCFNAGLHGVAPIPRTVSDSPWSAAHSEVSFGIRYPLHLRRDISFAPT